MLYVFVKIALFAVLLVKAEHKNNACNNYKSYLYPNGNPNCFYVPDNKDGVLEISRRHTGLGEAYDITTEDGYILRIFRIPRKNPKDVLLLQHGPLFDARQWLSQYNESIALIFWKAGYDVWMGNFRGNSYGKQHVKLSPQQKIFWDFSYHEMGYYDLHAIVEFIKKETRRSQILFLGHATSSGAALIYGSLRPQEAQSIKAMANIGPFAFSNHTYSPIKYTACPLGHFLLKYNLDEILHWYSVPEHDSWYIKLIRELNDGCPFKKLTALTLTFLGGGPIDRKDPRYMNLFIDQSFSALSWKTYDHYYQTYFPFNGEFRMYDYGKTKNLKIYGVEESPLYPLDNFQTPFFVVYSEDDASAPPEDIETLYSRLPEKTKMYKWKKIEGFGYFDYFFGKEMYEKVYKPVLEFLDSF